MFEGTIVKTIIDKIAKSEPRTTVLGFVLAGVIAAQVDYSKLMQKDPVQIGNLIGAIVTALLGYYTNNKSIKTT
jgi:hypothetical protein